MKNIDICGLGNALVDILVDVDERQFTEFELERASMRLVESSEQAQMLRRLQHLSPRLVSGGSVVNSVIVVSQLGARAGFISMLGDDQHGLFYKSECESLGVEVANAPLLGEATGTCLVLVTPDAERTMRTCLGVNVKLEPKFIDEELIARSRWLFIEGYVFANPHGPEAILQAVQAARNNGCRIALTMSEDFIPQAFSQQVQAVLPHCDLIFSNEREAIALSGRDSWREAFDALREKYPGVVVTCGEKGALIAFESCIEKVDAIPCKPVDLTGAGDVFAGALLYGIVNGFSIKQAGRAAAHLAMQVICKHGARLAGSIAGGSASNAVQESWNSAINSA